VESHLTLSPSSSATLLVASCNPFVRWPPQTMSPLLISMESLPRQVGPRIPSWYLIDLSQNHTLSDSVDKILTLQGISWVTRKIINNATITLDIKHYKDDEGAEHIDIIQTLTGGITSSPEYRTLTWTWAKVRSQPLWVCHRQESQDPNRRCHR
jgi:hypothetical protein